VVEGRVRVVVDPHNANLQPGEILVCTGTDPAWTPLFLAAGGLVMEVGGMMTHGAIVAREYGIPEHALLPGSASGWMAAAVLLKCSNAVPHRKAPHNPACSGRGFATMLTARFFQFG